MKIFILLLFKLTLFASNILMLTDDMKELDASSHTYYIKDKNSTLTANDVLQSSSLTLSHKNGHLGNVQGPFWSKLTIENDSNKSRAFIVHNLLPGTNYVDVYLYQNDLLKKSYLLGDMREQSNKEFVHRFSAFELLLAPKEQISIVSKVDNFSIVNIAWIIKETTVFIQEQSKFLIIFSLIGGAFILFILISFILFLSYKKIAYLFLGLFVTSSLLHQFALQGFLYTLDIGINLEFNTYIAWAGGPFSTIVLLLFTYHFFDMRAKYKKSSYFISFLIITNILILLSILYALLIDEKYFVNLTHIIGLPPLIGVIFLTLVGLYMKEIGHKYFLLGQVIMFISVTLHILAISNYIEFHHFYRYLLIIAVMIDIALLFIAQSLQTKKYLMELSKAKVMLIEQSRFSSMGQAIGHITHQWKHPLTLLGTSISLLQTILIHDKEKAMMHLEKELPAMNKSIVHMKQTMMELSKFYSGKLEKVSFSPIHTINDVIELLGSKIILKKATIKLDIDEHIKIYNYEHICSNIIIVLLDNSLDEFEYKNNNQILISMLSHNGKNILTYSDNAGGINIEPIESVFEYFISSKGEEEGHGIGLAMVKMLVEERLNGRISVENKNNGAEFKIYF